MSKLNRLIRSVLMCAYSLFLVIACGGEGGLKKEFEISVKVEGDGTFRL